MNRRKFIRFIGGVAVALCWPLRASAQQECKVRLIGFLRVGPPPPAWIEALRQGLRELGHVEGQNIAIEFVSPSDAAQLPEAATKLVELKVDVIFASGTPPLLVAKNAAGMIPVVFVAAIDPVATGLVANLARPGGNVTGLTNTQADITGKHLQLLKEVLPGLSRVAMLVRANSQASARYVEEAETAGRMLGVQLQIFSLRDPQQLKLIFSAAQGASAILVTDDAIFTASRSRIAELALQGRLPLITSTKELVKAGCLMSYGPDTTDLYFRAATYVDKILKGAKAGELPVQQPTKYELVINRNTADALGLVLPPTLLARADEVIE